jgi:hypothetical protein
MSNVICSVKPRKSPCIPTVLAASALVLGAPATSVTLLDDHFDNNDPASNGRAGYTVHDAAAFTPTEAGTEVSWGSSAAWNWGASELQSNNEFNPPATEETYTVEWSIGPMEATAIGDQPWGDIRMELSLCSANLVRGSGPAEMWANTVGIITAQVTLKEHDLAAPANSASVQFWIKDDAVGANANGSFLFQTSVDSTVGHKIAFELTESGVTCLVDAVPLGTSPLVDTTVSPPADLGWGPSEEFENGWFPLVRSGTANQGRGTMSIDRLTVVLEDGGASADRGVVITDASQNAAGELNISWESNAGLLYNVRSEVNPSAGDPLTWPLFDSHRDIAATPPQNTITLPRPADAERYFVIESFPKPPAVVFQDNFDDRAVLAPWTTTESGDPGSPWELSSPTALLGPPAAYSPFNSVGTSLGGDHGFNADSCLRSPPIDLSKVVSGTITYHRFVDIEPVFDSATVNLRNAADNSLIAELETGIEGTTIDWEEVSHDIPAAAIGESVIFEICFYSDSVGNQTGLVIDDFKVQGVEP